MLKITPHLHKLNHKLIFKSIFIYFCITRFLTNSIKSRPDGSQSYHPHVVPNLFELLLSLKISPTLESFQREFKTDFFSPLAFNNSFKLYVFLVVCI